jgi:predicted short-subunit dehydrogenase-like oxidoreductase (DUF2520 family)
MAESVVLLGTGNVAYHLAKHLKASAVSVLVWGRTPEAVRSLGSDLGVATAEKMAEIPVHADLYILAVSDGAIAVLAEQLRAYLPADALVVHTSGATPAGVLEPHFATYGVFYPLQTFSRGREVAMRQVPFCLWTSAPEDYTVLDTLAQKLSDTVVPVDDAQRQQLHLAAVFVNNFTNYLQHVSQSLLAEKALPPSLLQPLLRETVAKLETLSPVTAQTGPARRGDASTQARHLALLEDHPAWAEIYRLLSAAIGQLPND